MITRTAHFPLTIALTSALTLGISCKRPTTTAGPEVGLTSASISNAPPITVGPSADGISIGFGFHFRSTLNQEAYEVTQADCGYILRSARTEGIVITLPLLKFPCALMLFNERAGLMTVNLQGTAPDGTGGDFNGEKTFSLGEQEGAILSVNQSSVFYRGLYTCRGGFGACAAKGGSGTAIPTTYSDLSDFRATTTSNKILTISAGKAAIGTNAFPAAISGTVEFTAGTGDARVYLSKLGILTAEAVVGTTAKVTGQMVITTASTPSFPPGSIPICDLALSNGTYTIDSCDLASRIRTFALDAGAGIDITYSSGIAKISTDATVARADVPQGGTASATTYRVVPWIALLVSIAALILAIFTLGSKGEPN